MHIPVPLSLALSLPLDARNGILFHSSSSLYFVVSLGHLTASTVNFCLSHTAMTITTFLYDYIFILTSVELLCTWHQRPTSRVNRANDDSVSMATGSKCIFVDDERVCWWLAMWGQYFCVQLVLSQSASSFTMLTDAQEQRRETLQRQSQKNKLEVTTTSTAEQHQ